MACSGISQKPPLEDGTREAPYDDGTQGLKSKSTIVSLGQLAPVFQQVAQL